MGQSNHAHGASGAHQNEQHITAFGTYIKIYSILLVLTVVTVAASRIHFGAVMNVAIAMAIAVVKAALVVLYFMHQKYETQINRVIFFCTFLFVFLLFAVCSLDIWTRIALQPLPVSGLK